MVEEAFVKSELQRNPKQPTLSPKKEKTHYSPNKQQVKKKGETK